MSREPLSHETVEKSERVHRWLLAMGAGLLDEEREARLHEHLMTCDDCRKRLVALKNDSSDVAAMDEHHIPASLIATWPRASAGLRGIERRAVEHHLSRCEKCREDLALLGYAPELASAGDSSRSAAESPSSEPRTAVSLVRPNRARGLAGWLVPGWAILASAAAVVLVLTRPIPQAPAPAVGETLPRITLPRESFDLTRGSSPDATPPTFELPAGRQMLIFAALPLVAKPAAARTMIEVVNERDSILVSTTCLLGELADRPIPIDTGDRGFPAGSYSLRVSIAAGEGLEARVARFPFRIARRL